MKPIDLGHVLDPAGREAAATDGVQVCSFGEATHVTKAGIRRARQPRDGRGALDARQVLRVLCHLAVAAPFLVVGAYEMVNGWRPQGDDAVIVFRSWATFSSHPPLVGMLTHVTSSRPVYDPGPLLFWLLALPVHLDHVQGGLWGAELLCVVAVSLAVGAAWAVRGWPAAMGTAAVLLVMILEFPALALDPTWNAHVGLVWFVAAAVIGWAVTTGRLQWWPALVLVASFAAQSHLMFVPASVGLALVTPVAGYLRHRRLGWWFPAGLLVGLACWLAPLVQQLTSSPGNLSLLLHSQGSGSVTGLRFGLRSLAAAAGPHPVWWGQGQVPYPDLLRLSRAILSHPPWIGVAVLLGLGVCTMAAWLAHRRDLAGLALVTLVLSLGVVWALSSVPRSQLYLFPYIDAGSWPVGMATALVGSWSLGEVATAVARRARRERTARHLRPRRPARSLRWLLALPAVLVAAAVVAVPTQAVDAARHDNDPSSGWPAMRQVQVATQRIEGSVPRSRVMVLPPRGYTYAYTVIAGVDWQLYVDGWRPESVPGYPALIGPQVSVKRPLPSVTVVVHYDGGPVTTVISQARPRRRSGRRRPAPA